MAHRAIRITNGASPVVDLLGRQRAGRVLSRPVVTVVGILGTTEANGSWPVAVADATHLDLINSTSVKAYASGGAVTDIGNVPLRACVGDRV